MTFKPKITANSREIDDRISRSRSDRNRDRPWTTNMSNISTDSLVGGQSFHLNQSRTSDQEANKWIKTETKRAIRVLAKGSARLTKSPIGGTVSHSKSNSLGEALQALNYDVAPMQ